MKPSTNYSPSPSSPTLRAESGEQNGHGWAPVLPVNFKPKDAAAYLTLSPRTLWEETRQGHIHAARVGRRLIYPRAELDRFIAVRMAQAS